MLVKIDIKTTIFHVDGTEIIAASSPGCFYQKGNAAYLQYEEEGTRTTIKLAGDEALILRSGAVKMRLPFLLHKKTAGSYELPFGKWMIEAFAKRIESAKNHIDILYDFFMQGAPGPITYHLEITFQEEEK